MTRQDSFKAVQEINDKIYKLQAERNCLELKAIHNGEFKNWREFEAAFMKWSRQPSQ